MEAAEMPDGIDEELWFPCRHNPETRDYLYNASWHTFVGRMPAYCADRRVFFRISFKELPAELPAATQYWVQGYLAGSLPWPPEVDDDDDPRLLAYLARAERYFATGAWRDEDVDAAGDAKNPRV